MRALTEAERALLTSPNIEISAGLELLDTSNRLVEDISDDLVDGSVDYDNFATVHGSCRLSITRRLAWGRDRVRPFVVVSDGITTARFNQGVYVLTTPDERRGEVPQTWDVTGYNLLHLLQDGPADTYVVAAGTTYLQAVRDVVTASGVGADLRMDGTLQDTALPATRVWGLVGEGPSWLGIINDLLDEINYDNLWANEDGTLRSAPFMPLESRPVDWTLDTSDEGTNIVHQDRVVSEDMASAVNWWKFVRRDLPYQPFDGDGIYFPTVNATDAGETALGRIVRRVVFVEAADQAALVAQGDRIVAEDTAVTRTVDLQIDPLPVMGHGDTFRLVDEGVSEKLAAMNWSLSLTGDPGRLTLGGGRKPTPDRADQNATGTVTQASTTGLRVVLDGATTDSAATALADDSGTIPTYDVGTRVQVTVRTPNPPIVQGKETT